MFLTATNLPHYLMARGQVRAGELLDGELAVIDAGRRNRNFKILRGQQQGLFVKQVPLAAPETIGSLHREAVCYQLAQDHAGFAVLKPLVPRLVDYDPRRHTLTVELLKDFENLNEFHHRVQGFPERVGALLGEALASYHGAAAQMLAEPDALTAFPRTPPWVLTIAWNAEQVMPSMSPGQRQIITLLRQSPRMLAAVGELAATWQPLCLIHGDIKWDNFLFSSSSDGREELRIIDWELADVGDAAWDVACVLTAYVQSWLMSIPVDPSQPDPGVLVPHASLRLEATWPALRAFWSAYSRNRSLSPEQLEAQLLRCVRYAGVRFLLTAFELLPGASAPSPLATLAQRLAGVILETPRRAAVELFGFGPLLTRV